MKIVHNIKVFAVLGLLSCVVHGQADDQKAKEKEFSDSRDLTWEANKQLSENNFIEAEVDYRKAIAKSKENVTAPYNLGNAYYNNSSFSEAFGRYKEVGETATSKPDKHRAFHNLGNVFMQHKDYAKAVEAYKEALRNVPTDEETRYNLALAKELLKKDQEQQKQDDKDENKDSKDQKDKNQDQENQGDNKEENKGDPKEDENKEESNDGDKGDQQKEENKEGEGDDKKEEEKKPEQGDQPREQQQPRPNQLSPQQIKNLLEAMQNEEKKVQEKMDAKKVKGVKRKNEKDW
jgi:uncharacterized protein HemY